jgi:hypothetical protein
MPSEEKETVKLTEFIERTKKHHLTIEKVLSIPIGVTVRLFSMSRNIGDFINNDMVDSTPPRDFFYGADIVSFTRYSGISGIWRFDCWNDKIESQKRTFDVDVTNTGSECTWVPITNDGYVPSTDPDGLNYDMGSLAGLHWMFLNPTTRIGWQGPMMFEESLDSCPNVYYDDDI